jgi:hypothetical protein
MLLEGLGTGVRRFLNQGTLVSLLLIYRWKGKTLNRAKKDRTF